MLYRTLDCKIIEINRSMFNNDVKYYKKVLQTKINITKVNNISKQLAGFNLSKCKNLL